MGELAGFRVELVRPADDVAVVQASGELDIHTNRAFKECLVGAVQEGVARVVVDLTGVTFIDSSALGALVGGARRSAELRNELMIVCPPAAWRASSRSRASTAPSPSTPGAKRRSAQERTRKHS